jgi:phosphoglycerate dehydrogenase-like enzyme
MDEVFLAAAPKLRAVFYAAGSTRAFTTEAFWERGIVLSSAAAANAVPTAEYALGAILLSLRQFWRCAAAAKAGRGWGDHTRPLPGSYQRTVGLIALGMVGRLVRERLRAFDVRVIAYDPTRPDGDVELVSLERLFREADVVSVHAPWLPETEGLVTGELLASMKPGATLINTARGTIVRETELIEALRQRPDLTAVLDVTHPEPPSKHSPLLALPNVVLTPHIAGSHGSDIRRLGRYVVEELRRYVAGQPLQGQITRQTAALRA